MSAMRHQRIPAAATVLLCLAALTACEGSEPSTRDAAAPGPSAASAGASPSPSAATDGPGSQAPTEPTPTASGKSARPKQAGSGLARAANIDELRKLVHSSADCTRFFTDPDTVSIESIDYLPVVQGDPLAWGVTSRALCGQPGGERRAHRLNWLDMVGDMEKLQNKAKEAQLADLKDDGRIKATASKLLVGENVAVESNDESVHYGLYQAQFLYLNCVPGFTTPSGYREQLASVPDCVLTNYDPEHPAAG
ncbi:hypothetical protein [Streptomyces sp. NPDC001568]|uniref:hypothetical protein n=1 Tax=Streptomyces sp. NPDC001568 TaxID=3364588 RepID=UPI00369C68F6